MPIMDSQLLFGESQSIAAAAGANTDSTNEVYLPAVLDHTGTSRSDRPNTSGRLYWNCVVEDTALAAAVDGSVLTFTMYHHTATGAVAGGAILITAPTVTVNTSVTGATADGTQLFSIPLPQGVINPYLECNCAVATQNLSAGAVTWWIGGPIQQGGEHGAL